MKTIMVLFLVGGVGGAIVGMLVELWFSRRKVR